MRDDFRKSRGPEAVRGVYKLHVEYSNSAADYLYRLDCLVEYENGERTHQNTYTGDKAWAERHSKHYGIEMPEIEEK